MCACVYLFEHFIYARVRMYVCERERSEKQDNNYKIRDGNHSDFMTNNLL